MAVRYAVALAAAEMSEKAINENMSCAGTHAIVEGAKVQARKRAVLSNEGRLDWELAAKMADIEVKIVPELLNALLSACNAPEAGLHSSAAPDPLKAAPRAVEAASLEAVHEYRLDLERATVPGEHTDWASTRIGGKGSRFQR